MGTTRLKKESDKNTLQPQCFENDNGFIVVCRRKSKTKTHQSSDRNEKFTKLPNSYNELLREKFVKGCFGKQIDEKCGSRPNASIQHENNAFSHKNMNFSKTVSLQDSILKENKDSCEKYSEKNTEKNHTAEVATDCCKILPKKAENKQEALDITSSPMLDEETNCESSSQYDYRGTEKTNYESISTADINTKISSESTDSSNSLVPSRNSADQYQKYDAFLSYSENYCGLLKIEGLFIETAYLKINNYVYVNLNGVVYLLGHESNFSYITGLYPYFFSSRYLMINYKIYELYHDIYMHIGLSMNIYGIYTFVDPIQHL